MILADFLGTFNLLLCETNNSKFHSFIIASSNSFDYQFLLRLFYLMSVCESVFVFQFVWERSVIAFTNSNTLKYP